MRVLRGGGGGIVCLPWGAGEGLHRRQVQQKVQPLPAQQVAEHLGAARLGGQYLAECADVHPFEDPVAQHHRRVYDTVDAAEPLPGLREDAGEARRVGDVAAVVHRLGAEPRQLGQLGLDRRVLRAPPHQDQPGSPGGGEVPGQRPADAAAAAHDEVRAALPEHRAGRRWQLDWAQPFHVAVAVHERDLVVTGRRLGEHGAHQRGPVRAGERATHWYADVQAACGDARVLLAERLDETGERTRGGVGGTPARRIMHAVDQYPQGLDALDPVGLGQGLDETEQGGRGVVAAVRFAQAAEEPHMVYGAEVTQPASERRGVGDVHLGRAAAEVPVAVTQPQRPHLRRRPCCGKVAGQPEVAGLVYHQAVPVPGGWRGGRCRLPLPVGRVEGQCRCRALLAHRRWAYRQFAQRHEYAAVRVEQVDVVPVCAAGADVDVAVRGERAVRAHLLHREWQARRGLRVWVERRDRLQGRVHEGGVECEGGAGSGDLGGGEDLAVARAYPAQAPEERAVVDPVRPEPLVERFGVQHARAPVAQFLR